MIKNVLKKIMIKKVIFAEVSEFQLNALFIIFRGPTIFYHISFQNCNQFFELSFHGPGCISGNHIHKLNVTRKQ